MILWLEDLFDGESSAIRHPTHPDTAEELRVGRQLHKSRDLIWDILAPTRLRSILIGVIASENSNTLGHKLRFHIPLLDLPLEDHRRVQEAQFTLRNENSRTEENTKKPR